MKIKVTIITGYMLVVMLLATGCTRGINGFTSGNITNQNKETSTEELRFNLVDAQGIEVKINMGKVTIVSGEEDDVSVNVTYEAIGKDTDILSEILDAVTIDYKEESGHLILAAVHKDTKKDIWNWIRRNHADRNGLQPNLNVLIEVTLPKGVSEFEVAIAMGDINLEDLSGEFNIDNAMGQTTLKDIKGKFNINNAMGKVSMKNAEFEGNSNIIVNMGDLECDLSETMTEDSEVSMKVDMGSIRIDANGLTYTRQDKGDNYMGANSTLVFQDKCNISTKVAMGALTVSK